MSVYSTWLNPVHDCSPLSTIVFEVLRSLSRATAQLADTQSPAYLLLASLCLHQSSAAGVLNRARAAPDLAGRRGPGTRGDLANDVSIPSYSPTGFPMQYQKTNTMKRPRTTPLAFLCLVGCAGPAGNYAPPAERLADGVAPALSPPRERSCPGRTKLPADADAATPHAPEFGDVSGVWEGAIDVGDGGQLHARVEIVRLGSGELYGRFHSLDQGSVLEAFPITQANGVLRFELQAVGGVFEGTLDALLAVADGSWTQAGSERKPFVLHHTSADLPGAPQKSVAERDRAPFAMPFSAHIPHEPQPFRGHGQRHLAYELQLANLGSRKATLLSLEVLGDGRGLTTLRGAELERALQQFGDRQLDRAEVDAGQTLVAFLWLTLPEGVALPRSLTHKLEVAVTGYRKPVQAELPPSAVNPKPPRILEAPLRGGIWMANGAPSNASYHRRALIAPDGVARIAQRFATDWVKRDAAGDDHGGDPRRNESYFAYGSEVLAVGAGRVASVLDGVPNNDPSRPERAVPMTLENLAGNFVSLDLGGGTFALYAHLQPGSLRVAVGEHVRAGQVLGLVGNSGNSSGPHLHFHLSESAEPVAGEGLPFVFRSFRRLPKLKESGFALDLAVAVSQETPLQGDAIVFSD